MPRTIKMLLGFHIRSTYWMSRVNKPRKDPQLGIWTYPASALALEEVGLETIGYYIQVRRQHIAAYIVDRPIFGFYEEGVRKRGTTPQTWWWEQHTDFDLVRGAAEVGPIVTDDKA